MTCTLSEACRVRIRWLQPGEVAYEADLNDAHDDHSASSIVCWRTLQGWQNAYAGGCDEDFYSKAMALDKGELLGSLHMDWNSCHARPDWALDRTYSPGNPVMKVVTPVRLFEFEAGAPGENWLAYEMADVGVYEVFGQDLDALENIGFWLWQKGQAVDRERWGVSVCFHAVWEYTVFEYHDGDQDVKKQFHGWLDLRDALATCTTLPPKTERPSRRPALAHRIPLAFTLCKCRNPAVAGP